MTVALPGRAISASRANLVEYYAGTIRTWSYQPFVIGGRAGAICALEAFHNFIE